MVIDTIQFPDNIDAAANESISRGGKWKIRRNYMNELSAITLNDIDVLHIKPSLRTEACVQTIVDLLNNLPASTINHKQWKVS